VDDVKSYSENDYGDYNLNMYSKLKVDMRKYILYRKTNTMDVK
jgi:hypothetical protein